MVFCDAWQRTVVSKDAADTVPANKFDKGQVENVNTCAVKECTAAT